MLAPGVAKEALMAQNCARMVPGARYLWVQDRVLHDFAGTGVKMRPVFRRKP